MRSVMIAGLALAAMEPITAATHRWLMHGLGDRLHRSHHSTAARRWEANDAFPVMFAAVVCIGLWLGFNVPGWSGLVAVGTGITMYGVAYAIVHDVYIHQRLRLARRMRSRLLDRLASAHRVHHLFGGAPFGMLVPVVPRELRHRAAATSRDPIAERIAAAPGP